MDEIIRKAAWFDVLSERMVSEIKLKGQLIAAQQQITSLQAAAKAAAGAVSGEGKPEQAE